MDALSLFREEVDPWQYFESHYDPYTGPHRVFTELATRHISRKEIKPADVYVDLASGPGTSLLAFLDTFPFKKCVAVDGSRKMLSFIPVVTADVDVTIEKHVCDLARDPVLIEKGTVSLVTCCMALSYMASIENVFSSATEMLRSGGYFLMDVISFESRSTDTKPLYQNVDGELDMYMYPQAAIFSLAFRHNLNVVGSRVAQWRRGKQFNPVCYDNVLLFQKR